MQYVPTNISISEVIVDGCIFRLYQQLPFHLWQLVNLEKKSCLVTHGIGITRDAHQTTVSLAQKTLQKSQNRPEKNIKHQPLPLITVVTAPQLIYFCHGSPEFPVSTEGLIILYSSLSSEQFSLSMAYCQIRSMGKYLRQHQPHRLQIWRVYKNRQEYHKDRTNVKALNVDQTKTGNIQTLTDNNCHSKQYLPNYYKLLICSSSDKIERVFLQAICLQGQVDKILIGRSGDYVVVDLEPSLHQSNVTGFKSN